ncbi:hypothetical protein GUITHDRAFT_165845, partial [Guillardia theta CCMP2712]
MTTLYGRHLSEDGTQLDYGGMAASEEYAGYKALAEGLREVDTRSMGEEERVAFFINVYNCLVIDAIISLGKPKDLLSRLRMYAEAAYNIGGATFSLNDIENGVLRGNQSPPTINPFAQKPFGEGDARAGIACKKPDPRIHFALNCGARGCPPIRFYRGEELDAMLDKAARSFCRSIEVDQDKGVVYMSQIFEWYENDFQSDSTDKPLVSAMSCNDELDKKASCVCACGCLVSRRKRPPISTLRFVKKYLDEDKKDALSRFLESGKELEVRYQQYDWGLNSS